MVADLESSTTGPLSNPHSSNSGLRTRHQRKKCVKRVIIIHIIHSDPKVTFDSKTRRPILGSSRVTCCVVELQVSEDFRVMLAVRTKWRTRKRPLFVFGVVPRQL